VLFEVGAHPLYHFGEPLVKHSHRSLLETLSILPATCRLDEWRICDYRKFQQFVVFLCDHFFVIIEFSGVSESPDLCPGPPARLPRLLVFCEALGVHLVPPIRNWNTSRPIWLESQRDMTSLGGGKQHRTAGWFSPSPSPRRSTSMCPFGPLSADPLRTDLGSGSSNGS